MRFLTRIPFIYVSDLSDSWLKNQYSVDHQWSACIYHLKTFRSCIPVINVNTTFLSIENEYLLVGEKAMTIFIRFLTTYLSENTFSFVTGLTQGLQLT